MCKDKLKGQRMLHAPGDVGLLVSCLYISTLLTTTSRAYVRTFLKEAILKLAPKKDRKKHETLTEKCACWLKAHSQADLGPAIPLNPTHYIVCLFSRWVG